MKLVPIIGARYTISRMIGTNAMESHHPHKPHYYLLAVGVSPGNQGKGLGTRILQPALQKCDQEKIPAYLETSSKRVIGLYQKLGCECKEMFDIPYNGPTTWTMWREPM